jgi:hypothetical protein
MYLNKFSSGTILALLALSGMLVLVPIAAPVHATQNASPPTLTVGINAYITAPATTSGTTLKIANPITNSYAILSITIFAPASFAFSGATGLGTYFTANPVATASAETFTGSLPPGFTDTITLGTITSSVLSPANAAPPTAVFTTTLIDGGSSPASYPGPIWTVYTLATGTTISTPVVATNFVAGTAPLTITASDSTNQPGVPINFKVTTAPTSGFTATVSPASTVTVAGTSASTASTSFTPSNHATDATTITVTVGASGITTQSGVVTTIAGSPSTVSWSYGATAFGVGKNLYLTTGVSGVSFGVTNYGGSTIYAKYGIATPLTVSVADAFLNPILLSAINTPAITVTAPSGIGAWDSGAATAVNPITCANAGISCATGAFLIPYAQSYPYGTTAVLQATITGTYPLIGGTLFSVAATSGNIITGTQATSLVLTAAGTPTLGVGTTITLTATPNVGTQPGVPVTFNLCPHTSTLGGCTSSSAKYGGSFSSGAQTGFVATTGGTTGAATAVYTLPTVLGLTGTFNATALAPTGATPVPTIASNLLTEGPTVAGAAVGFKVSDYFTDTAGVLSNAVKASLVTGQTTYVDISLVDAYGNAALNPGPSQIQILLTVAPAADGTLSSYSVYISFGQTDTAAAIGPIQFVTPSGLALGTAITLTATGVVSGVQVTASKSISIVSALPTINLKLGSLNGPVIPTGTTIYSPTGAITFYSKANASAGFAPTNTIATIGTKIGSAPWTTTLTPGTNPSLNTFSLFFPTGLSTLSVNATDSMVATGAKFGNIGTTGPYNILVDPYLPTFVINTPVAGSGSVTVTVTSTEGDFNTTTFAATYGGVAVPSASVSWSGTQTLGVSSTLTATVSGLTAGTNTLTVTGKTDAGLAGTASASITITIVFADSITFVTSSATWGSSGAAQGVFVPVTNSWNAGQQLTIYVTLKSGTSTYVLVGGETLAAGQTATVFCQDFAATVPVGTYTVTFSAITTANQAVSAPTTPITLTS